MADNDTQPSTNPLPTAPPPDKGDEGIVCRLHCSTHQISGIILEDKNGLRQWRIGRDRSCEVYISASKRISKVHFIISKSQKDDTLLIKDVSTNGTLLNNIRLTKNQGYILAQGDEITVGYGVSDDVMKFIVSLPASHDASNILDKGIHAHYDLRSGVIGRGAFATVKRAVERSTGNHYAVKVIDKKKVMHGMAVQREVEILKTIQHENIVALKDYFEDNQYHYLVMDLIEGGDLMDFITNNGVVPEDAAIEIATQVLSAVSYMHSINISHRDIKPDNILIAQDEPVIVKVSDFGLAKIAQSGSHLKTFCGTLAYRKNYSDKVDIWSIGCMVYVILTGFLPFPQPTQQELYEKIIKGQITTKYLKEAGISPEGIDFIKYLLVVDPAARPSAASALLHPWLTGRKLGDDLNVEVHAPPNAVEAPIQEMSNLGVRSKENSEKKNSNERIVSTAPIPSSAPKHKVPSDTSPPPLDDDEGESDRDGEDIKNEIIANSQQANKENIIKIQGGNQPDNSRFVSIVRDIDVQTADEYPVSTWLALNTLDNSSPHPGVFLTSSRTVFGRVATSEVDIVVNFPQVSKKHCIIYVDNSGEKPTVWLIDTSSNGCYVNNRKVGKGNQAILQHNDKVYLFWDRHSRKFLGFVANFLEPSKFSTVEPNVNRIYPTTSIPTGLSVIKEVSEMQGHYDEDDRALQHKFTPNEPGRESNNNNKRPLRVSHCISFFLLISLLTVFISTYCRVEATVLSASPNRPKCRTAVRVGATALR